MKKKIKNVKFEYFINEIIRVNYRCNWKCIFCNVSEVNNYWDNDIDYKEVVKKIILLAKKYNLKERKKLLLSFSWWEPTLNKNLINYIKLAKKIWIWRIQIQTNASLLYNDLWLIDNYILAWLDEVFIAQHSHDPFVNKDLWVFTEFDKFLNWFEYVKNKKSILLIFNIVVTKLNIYSLIDYLDKLKENGVFNHIYNISIWFVQPNWYAWKNKNKVLLTFDWKEKEEINKIINYSKQNNILLDFHYTSPPLCIVENIEYNLEYKKLKLLEEQSKENKLDPSLDSFFFMKSQKVKIDECRGCKYDKYCFWFYNNWINFIWKELLVKRINEFKQNY